MIRIHETLLVSYIIIYYNKINVEYAADLVKYEGPVET